MTTEETAAATAECITSIPSRFMIDGATFARGAELGCDGLNFYVVGRGGVLGDVDADIVSAAFVFFNPDAVRPAWEAGTAALAPGVAAEEFAGCAHRWADDHLDDDTALWSRLAELAGRVVAAASPSGVPVFAGWRRLAEPESPRALAVHRLNALRELRGGLHGAAVLAAGMAPRHALLVKTPYMAAIFGWPEPQPDVSALGELWASAEAATNRAFGAALAVLDDREQSELVDLAGRALAAAH